MILSIYWNTARWIGKNISDRRRFAVCFFCYRGLPCVRVRRVRPNPKGPIVLFSIILPNDTADVKVMLPLIEMMKKIEGLKVDYLECLF